MKITSSGIYPDITNEEYHSGVGVSKSDLDLIHRSPAHFQSAKIEGRKTTDAMILGSAVHCAILEPDLFAQRYIRSPVCDKRTKEGKAQYAVFEMEAITKNLTPLSADMYETALKIRDAVHAHKLASSILKAPGKVEQSVYWYDDIAIGTFQTGDNSPAAPCLCKCRPDFLRDDGIVVDVKTTTDARPESFRRSVADYRYFVQQAYYSDGLRAIGRNIRDFIFLVVEKEPPYAVAVYMLNDEAETIGRMHYKEDLRVYFNCLTSGTWPGYTEQVSTLDLPKWIL